MLYKTKNICYDRTQDSSTTRAQNKCEHEIKENQKYSTAISIQFGKSKLQI